MLRSIEVGRGVEDEFVIGDEEIVVPFSEKANKRRETGSVRRKNPIATNKEMVYYKYHHLQ